MKPFSSLSSLLLLINVVTAASSASASFSQSAVSAPSASAPASVSVSASTPSESSASSTLSVASSTFSIASTISSSLMGNATSSFSASVVPSSTFAVSSSAGPISYSIQPSPDPASSHFFNPYPTPTQAPVPGVFVPTDPSNPPPVDSNLIPDFNPAWATAYEKAKEKIASFTLEEKVNVTTGIGWALGRCVGNTPPVAGKGFPGLCLEDSPVGVRDTDFATVFPAGITTASTWKRSLCRARGEGMGSEFKGKGVHVALGPMMNMGRDAQGGRNWEGFGADPYLSGNCAHETVLGMQQGGVQATAKHYINNEQEHFRTTESSNVDDRTQHEIYAYPFLRSVQAGVASVMCSYNQINDTYACENDKTLNDILKREFGFQGYVMSDWSATHSTLGALYGLDMTMPGDIAFGSGTSYFGGNLTAYVQNGSIPESRLDDMATRIVAAWYFLKQDSGYPDVNFNAFLPLDEATNDHVNVQDDHYKIVREIGSSSAILLKNTNHALPLVKPRSLLLVGLDAASSPGGPNEFSDQGGNDGTLALGWGSGTANFTYLISPLEAIQIRARQDSTSVNWWLNNWNTVAATVYARQSDTALVFLNSDSGEGYITVDNNEGDRNNLTSWHNGDALVEAVASVNNNTIVILHSVGPLILEPWIEHPNVTAVVWAGIPGPESGNGLVDVLYGDYNPSGRLPFTIAKEPSDYPAAVVFNSNGAAIVQIPYTEGLFIDYRHFDAADIEPRFEFGFGLSYTKFEYLTTKTTKLATTVDPQSASAWEQGKAAPISEGSSAALWLHQPAVSVTLKLKNIGSVDGTEIPQLYLSFPASSGEPPSVLKGFTDIFLNKGQEDTVTFTLSRFDLSIWDVVRQSWVRPEGTITYHVGASSRDFRLSGTIPI